MDSVRSLYYHGTHTMPFHHLQVQSKRQCSLARQSNTTFPSLCITRIQLGAVVMSIHACWSINCGQFLNVVVSDWHIALQRMPPPRCAELGGRAQEPRQFKATQRPLVFSGVPGGRYVRLSRMADNSPNTCIVASQFSLGCQGDQIEVVVNTIQYFIYSSLLYESPPLWACDLIFPIMWQCSL